MSTELLAASAAAVIAAAVLSAAARLVVHAALRRVLERRSRRRTARSIAALVRDEYQAVSTSPDRADEVPVLHDRQHPATRQLEAAFAAVAAADGGNLDTYEAAVGRLAAAWQHLQDPHGARQPGRRNEVRTQLLRFRVDTGELTVQRPFRLPDW